jgi:hypothetical protein
VTPSSTGNVLEYGSHFPDLAAARLLTRTAVRCTMRMRHGEAAGVDATTTRRAERP